MKKIILLYFLLYSTSVFGQNTVRLNIHHKLGAVGFENNLGVENNIGHHFKVD